MLHSPIVTAGPGSVELPRSPAPIVKANDLLFVHFERPDLDRAEQYLRDFGLIVVSKSDKELFFRGTGSRPYVYRVTRGPRARFVGLGLSVPSSVRAAPDPARDSAQRPEPDRAGERHPASRARAA